MPQETSIDPKTIDDTDVEKNNIPASTKKREFFVFSSGAFVDASTILYATAPAKAYKTIAERDGQDTYEFAVYHRPVGSEKDRYTVAKFDTEAEAQAELNRVREMMVSLGHTMHYPQISRD